MWVREGHRPETSSPPEDTGRRLATLDRGRGEELRISLAEFNGHQFINARVWASSQDGSLWPVRGKGLAIKHRELAQVIEALQEAAELVGESPAPPPARAQRQTAPSRQPAGSVKYGNASVPSGDGFDESDRPAPARSSHDRKSF